MAGQNRTAGARRKPVIACLMPLRLTTRVTLAATFLLAFPATAHAQDVVRPSSVTGGTTVPAGGSKTLTLRCPGTGVALNAAVTSQAAGVTVRRSTPGTAANDWRFRVSAAAGAAGGRVGAVLRCVRLRLPQNMSGARLLIRTRMRPFQQIQAGAPAAKRVRCGRGWIGTGYGLDYGASGELRVAEAVPDASGWRFRVENTGARVTSASVSVRCLKRTVAARRSGARTSLGFQVARSAVVNEVPAGSRAVRSSCTRRQFSLATGVSFDWRDDIVQLNSHPRGERAGLWSFSQAGGIEPVRSFLVCLGRRSQFN
jgi:hypothetical protein